MNITLSITRAEVNAEVAKTTAYEGAHSGAFDNVFAKPEDREMLERYWTEATTLLTDVLKKRISGITNNDTKYEVSLSMPQNFDSILSDTMKKSAFSHLSNYIIGKWLEMLSIEKASSYFTIAGQSLGEVKNMFLHRKAPTRPTD